MGNPSTDYEQLSTAEKILRLQEQWDRIAEVPDDVELTEAQRRALDARLEAMDHGPDACIPWAAVKAALLKKP
jgi:putative addiction module component (TIGR02574 family)